MIQPVRAVAVLTIAALISCVLVCGAACSGRSVSPDHGPRVVLVSIDGLRPDFYLDPSFEAPTLQRLAREGARADGMEPVFPTLTFPNHVSMVTGVSSARHGILANTVFDPATGPSTDWYWYARAIQVPTLWKKAKQAGKTVAIVRWPASAGADADWLFPEIFRSPGIHLEPDWAAVVENTDPALLKEILPDSSYAGYKSFAELDELSTQAALKILDHHHPDLLAIHLINVDLAQHLTGRSSPETRAALAGADRLLARLAGALDLGRDTLFVVGDHGFADFSSTIQLNTLFSGRGWIRTAPGKPLEWRAYAHTEGGQAAIYVHDRAVARAVLALLKREAKDRYVVVPRADLDALGAYPGALCALEAREGFSFGSATDGPLIVHPPSTRGTHGQLGLDAGFIAAGAGVHPGTKIGRLRTIDVAPTVARALGIDLGTIEGRAAELQGPTAR
jgi:predicted AlkP superfamily pyrophosphatase or phosphodiesterase